MRLLLVIIITLIVLSVLNYVWYVNRLTAITRQANGAVNANGVNEPLSDLMIFAGDQPRLYQERHNFFDRELVLAIAAGVAVVFTYRKRRLGPN